MADRATSLSYPPGYQLKLKRDKFPSMASLPTFEQFLKEYEEESQKFRCSSTHKLMRDPCKFSRKYYESITVYSGRTCFAYRSKIRRFVCMTFIILVAVKPGTTERTLEIVNECLPIVSEGYMCHRVRTLRSHNAQDVEYILMKYAEATSFKSLMNLAIHLATRTSLPYMLPAIKLSLSSSACTPQFLGAVNRLLGQSFSTSAGSDIEVLCSYLELYSQHQLEDFHKRLNGRRDAKVLSGFALRIAGVAKELELKRTYLKLLKRLRVTLEPVEEVEQFLGKSNLKSTESTFESLLHQILPLCHDTQSQSLCHTLRELYLSLKDEIAKSADSDESLLEAIKRRREDAGIVGRQIDGLLPPSKEEKSGDFYYWIERNGDLNRINVHTSVRQLLGIKFNIFSDMNVVSCDNLRKILIVVSIKKFKASYGYMFGINLHRDFSLFYIPPMQVTRHSHGIIQHEGYVYVVGGLEIRGKAYHPERLSLNTRKWEFFEEVPVVYENPSLTTLNKHLYAMGCAKATASIFMSELCLVTLTWNIFAVSMPSVQFYLPLLFRISNHDPEFLILNVNSLWSINPSTGSTKYIRDVQRSYLMNCNWQIASNKLYGTNYHQNLVTIADLSSLIV
mmetsp:Transcript_26513/g.47605  ORF Transcript_26513/g.47605 Transcript_26513/m.47605 type:complete len:620 (+) Transcript_26513:33-1892(+)